jgi:hypothetical protein
MRQLIGSAKPPEFPQKEKGGQQTALFPGDRPAQHSAGTARFDYKE